MNTVPLKLAVLDCDGTIVDSKTAIITSMTAAFVNVDLAPPKPEEIVRIVGLNLADAMDVLLQGQKPEKIPTLVDAYREVATQHRAGGQWENPLYPDAKEVIQALNASGWLLGVATGKSKRGLDAVFDTHEIGHHFVTAQTSDIGPGKPAPDMLYRALRETGVEARNTVMIGDTTFDMEMAMNAGVSAIGVSWGYHTDKDLLAAGARVIVHGFQDLPGALESTIGDRI
ncbi:MAG: haloacid dehalogenase [Rhodospirillaceae bacterium]|nr:haloacid dehalogenase [Rhodospirillaceae bacterium]